MLQPKKVKWRKQQKGRRKGTAWRGSALTFGDYGLQVLDRGWLTAREIEAARVAISRAIHRGGRVWVLALPRGARVKALRFDDRRARITLLPAAEQCGYRAYGAIGGFGEPELEVVPR